MSREDKKINLALAFYRLELGFWKLAFCNAYARCVVLEHGGGSRKAFRMHVHILPAQCKPKISSDATLRDYAKWWEDPETTQGVASAIMKLPLVPGEQTQFVVDGYGQRVD